MIYRTYWKKKTSPEYVSEHFGYVKACSESDARRITEKINFVEKKVSIELKKIKEKLKNGVLEDIEAANSLYEFVTENKNIKNYDYIEFICYSLSCQDFLDDMEMDFAIKKLT